MGGRLGSTTRRHGVFQFGGGGGGGALAEPGGVVPGRYTNDGAAGDGERLCDADRGGGERATPYGSVGRVGTTDGGE